MLVCRIQMNVSLSQLRKTKKISVNRINMILFLYIYIYIYMLHLLPFVSSKICESDLHICLDCQDLCYQLLISGSMFWPPASNAEIPYVLEAEWPSQHGGPCRLPHTSEKRRLLPTPVLTVPKIFIYLSPTLQFRASSGISASVVF